MRITVRGFIVTDFMAKWGEAATEVQKAIADGRFWQRVRSDKSRRAR
jgi:NADPH-dependent curcumin reductase CurA